MLLRRFLSARRARDEAAARAAWDELVTLNFDRVRAMVRVESRAYLSHEEQEDAVQVALTRMLCDLLDTFRGTSMGEWVQATRRLIAFACRDVQRRNARHTLRRVPLGDGEERPEPAAPAEDDDDADEDALAFLDWAIPRLRGRRRDVIELDRQGVPGEEIQARLGVSRDVVYQSRSRGLRDLAKLRGEYEGT